MSFRTVIAKNYRRKVRSREEYSWRYLEIPPKARGLYFVKQDSVVCEKVLRHAWAKYDVVVSG